jgi:hypothetical protein
VINHNFLALRRFPYILLALIFLAAAADSVGAQILDDSDFQSWNDLQITAPITKNLELFTVTTLQIHDNISKIDNVRFGVGVTAKPVKGLAITPFMTFMSDRNILNNFRYEYRPAVRAVYKYQFKHFALGHRSQFEYRFRPGRNSWRYRPSVAAEKPLPASWAKGTKVFAAAEPFYDSLSGRFSRFRFGVGVNKSLNEHLSVDVFYFRQGDNFSLPRTVNGIGTVWRLDL